MPILVWGDMVALQRSSRLIIDLTWATGLKKLLFGRVTMSQLETLVNIHTKCAKPCKLIKILRMHVGANYPCEQMPLCSSTKLVSASCFFKVPDSDTVPSQYSPFGRKQGREGLAGLVYWYLVVYCPLTIDYCLPGGGTGPRSLQLPRPEPGWTP